MGTCKITNLNNDDISKLASISRRIYDMMDPWARDEIDATSPDDIRKDIKEMPLDAIEYLLDLLTE